MTRPSNPQILIIGGGVIGNAIAYFLSLDPGLRDQIVVVERDPTFRTASTALSAASIRTQFSNALNVQISKFGAEFIRNFSGLFSQADPGPDLEFRENGYLFLAGTQEQAALIRENHAIQSAAGADVILLEPAAIRDRFGYLNTSDLRLGALGVRGEGWFDNMGLHGGLRRLAKGQGARFVTDEVVGFDMADRRLVAARMASGERLVAGEFINAAGPRAAALARLAGVALPIEARKRTTFAFQTPEPPPPDAPLMVDPTGFYVRPERDFWIGACQPDPDPMVDADDFTPTYAEFDETLWPGLAARSPLFEAMKFRRAWAGHYAYNVLDQNAVLGRHPEVDNLIFANGFSGHGLQQAPAVGRGIAELIRFGRYTSLDLAPLGYERIISGRPFNERNVV